MRYSLVFLVAGCLTNGLPLHTASFNSQEPLLLGHSHTGALQKRPTYLGQDELYERGPQSVELLLTSGDADEMIRTWVPLGKRTYTYDHADFLPPRPETVQISNVLVYPRDEAANARRLEEATCTVYFVTEKSERRLLSFGWWRKQKNVGISFRRSDGIVDLDEAARRWKLSGHEVESYECS